MTYIIVFMVIDVTFISFCSWYYTVKWFEMCKCCKCLECVSCHLLKAAVTCGHGEGGGGVTVVLGGTFNVENAS